MDGRQLSQLPVKNSTKSLVAFNPNPEVFVLVGPTASGKSSVALTLAKTVHGEIVNGDSRQIYQLCNWGTSTPSPEERRSVPHHLYDFLSPNISYSAGDYARDATKTIQDILKRNKIPIVVGGTGLYLKALFDGLDPLPKRDEAVRKKLTLLLESKGKQKLHEELKKIDPDSAQKIDYQNSQRVLRALEVSLSSGTPFSQYHTQKKTVAHSFQPRFFGLLWKKEDLRKRIEERTRQMIPNMIEECQNLQKLGFSETSAFQSIGYDSIRFFLQGKLDGKQLYEAIVLDTLHYAKRQRTWFKRDSRITWIALENPFNPESIVQNDIIQK